MAFLFFNGFYNSVVNEVGEEKALNLLEDMGKAMGIMQGKMLKSQLRRDKIKEVTPSIAGPLTSGVIAGLGIETETIEESPEKISFKINKCPVYEATKLMGLDPETMCRHSAMPFMNTIVKQLDPNLGYELEKYRSGPDDFCQESIVLKKEALIER
ncbi:MAG: hypothetical protein V3V33_14555 [Candidatus Lokiarchaeia archaeon]